MVRKPESKTIDDLGFILGRLENGQVIIQQTLSEDRMASAQYRTEVRQRLSDYGERLTFIEASLANQTGDISEMRPKISALEAAAHQSIGVRNFLSASKGLVQLILGLVGASIALLIDKLFFHK